MSPDVLAEVGGKVSLESTHWAARLGRSKCPQGLAEQRLQRPLAAPTPAPGGPAAPSSPQKAPSLQMLPQKAAQRQRNRGPQGGRRAEVSLGAASSELGTPAPGLGPPPVDRNKVSTSPVALSSPPLRETRIGKRSLPSMAVASPPAVPQGACGDSLAHRASPSANTPCPREQTVQGLWAYL